MRSSHLVFNAYIGRKKPENIRNRSVACPFCDRDNLEGIIETRGSIIWLPNKFNVLEETFQTVIIETDQCDAELSTYRKDHIYELMSFVVEKWQEMQRSGKYKSVVLFKNHGPYSGGTIAHPHMQIIGFHEYDYMLHTVPEHFEGVPIHEQNGVICNLSTKPRIGFSEFNVILSNPSSIAQIEQMADMIQSLTHYILNVLNQTCKSYNLFFYQLDERICVKVVPRFVSSPLFIGYSIPQVLNNQEETANDVRQRYFASC
ncbi:DUF4931 domain-containing protein [Brevibacillus ginsengisoli]|uniref:DUF4931 domain-containing protein n=1 Tax=Brevibacillus ginsengisoli TaxID=363854 RepID=UPI003CF2372B